MTTLQPSTAASIEADVTTLRASFRQGKLKSLESRKRILRQIQKLVSENTSLFEEAIMKDLHRHPSELFLAEIAHVLSEVQEALDYLNDWAAPKKVSTNLANIPGTSRIVREPLGVCCIIDTFNYPISLALAPLIGCISAGNCGLVRLPPEGTCDNITAALASLIDKYIDADVVRYVVGGIEPNIAMLKHKFDLIFVTGGLTIGKIVARAAAEHLTPTVLELGGKSPCIVDESVDLKLAARRIAWGSFMNCGHTCVRPDYLLIHSKVADTFVRLLIDQLHEFFGDDPQQSSSYGRIVNQGHTKRLVGIVESDRAFVIHGGKSDLADRYLAPTVLNFKTNFQAFEASASMQDELFGPVLPMVYYDQLDPVLDFINGRPKPLALYVFATNSRMIDTVMKGTTSGGFVANDTIVHYLNSHLPFGGVGGSGMGAYHGKHSFEAFSHKKSVLLRGSYLDLPQRYMPYTPSGFRVLKLALSPITRAQVRFALGTTIVTLAAIAFAFFQAKLKAKTTKA
ncbi:hypothetical protein AC1031_014912 [Aphanomyces cochlioides]|nr:hypothetical protein AC1031_014912 [Aphanomyces cochlioides]